MYMDKEFVKKYDGLITSKINKAGIFGDQFDHIRAKVYERILASNSYDPNKGKITTWLWQVCRSVIANEVKKHSRSQDAMDHQPLQLDDANNIIGQEDAGTALDEIDRIMGAAIGISHRDKEIVKMSYLQNSSTVDIAEKYDMEQRAVEQVIYRAMKALRQAVKDDA